MKVLNSDVSWLELLYDLVLVAALILINESLLEKPFLGGIGMATLSLSALYVLWLLTALINNRFPSERIDRRLLTVVQMLLLFIAAQSAVSADGHLMRLAALGAALLTVSAMYFLASRGAHGPAPRTGRAALVVLAAAGACFVGIVFTGWASSAILVAALVIALIPLKLVHAGGMNAAYPIRGEHLRDRLGQLMLIAFGEGFIAMVFALGLGDSTPNYLFLVLTFATIFALGATYFDSVIANGYPTTGRRWIGSLAAHLLVVMGAVAALDGLSMLVASEPIDLVADAGLRLALAFSYCMAGYAVIGWANSGRFRRTEGLHAIAAAVLLAVGVLVAVTGWLSVGTMGVLCVSIIGIDSLLTVRIMGRERGPSGAS